ncbi:hypothetical protein ACFO26_02945 [Lactococcus nasutitermitis]|uniref:Prophage ps3 protein 11 n=1 Tax=Lactococcus nasutitermitis TaxID=1652957 RepID=A0ABV9JAM6_9LACT|nr:hypothetical protein [Lactococcus nasutitermitis]
MTKTEVQPSPEKLAELEKQRDAWEALEKNLEKVKSLPWEKFDNIDSAKIPQALDLVQVLHRDSFIYQYLQVKQTGEKKRVPRPSLHLNNGLISVSIFYGAVNTKTEKDGNGETREVAILKGNKNLPRFVTAILDYLFGTIAFEKDNLYLINDSQFILLSELELSHRYKTGSKGDFRANELLDILKFIHEQLKLEPVKKIQTAVIACTDFQIDLKARKILTDCALEEDETYFKVFDSTFREVMDLVKTYDTYLNMVIDDADSLHNASLQPIYTMLIACRELSKERFFISKSAERTGKGLRHEIISSVFETKSINLDALKGKMSDFAWASYDGGEMLLVTEAGAIDKSVERYLKILATESKVPARKIGNDYAEINLTGILAIDSNEKILLSSGMNSRVVNIAFRDRPKKETDSERRAIFAPYWQAFTAQKKNKTSRSATTTAGLASLVHSFLYWQSEKFQFNFKQVEMNNFTGENAEFDDVQVYVLEEYTKGKEFVFFTDNIELQTLMKETYFGTNKKERRKQALDEIGSYLTPRKFLNGTQTGYRSMKIIKKQNIKRVQKALNAFIESMMDDK